MPRRTRAARSPFRCRDRSRQQLLNRAIAAGSVVRADDTPQTEPVRAALITRDRKTLYRIDDGIPVLLIEEGIPVAAVQGL